jgi:O-succinylbenzoic acid--CoA ligase
VVVHRLVALDLPGGPNFVDALRRVWDDGDAAFVLDQRLPRAAAERTLRAVSPAIVRNEQGDSPLDHAVPIDDDDALVIATSGTSGEPKGVVLTHAAVRASADATSRRIGVRDDDHWLACLPIAHVGGLSVITRALHLGTRLTVLAGFDPAAAMSSGATLASLVPTALARLDARRFRVLLVGGASAPKNLPENVLTTYGMTETGSGVVYSGRPLDGVEVRIDHDGIISLRGPMLLRTYRNGVDPKDHDGWFATGDVGEWTGSGEERRLVVHGRRGDMINTGGEKVWPDAVEHVLSQHPSIAEVAIVGLDDPEWGQRVVAVVIPRDGASPTLESLRETVKDTLPAYCAPRQLELVDAIPRTALGKIRRADLVAALTSRRSD